MYKRRRDRYAKLRINKFKGLNQADNPRQIDDAELSVMKNLYLEKDGTIKSRKGWQMIADALTFTRSICGMCKTYWEDVGSAVYMMGDYFLYSVNLQNWASTSMGAIGSPSEHVQFLRYKDKLLFLFPGKELKYIDSGDALSVTNFPEVRVGGNFGSAMAASAGGDLDSETTYQYCISLGFGIDYRDGETAGSLPERRHPFPGGDHAYATTTADNRKITSSDVNYYSQLHGKELTYVNLYRREAIMTESGKYGAAPGATWEWLNTAYLKKEFLDPYWLYSTESDTTGTSMDVTGLYAESTDNVILSVYFIDDGSVGTEAGNAPRDSYSNENPKAKYTTRLHNRILLANIQDTTLAVDKKKVYYSYRGDTGLGTHDNPIWEIQDFVYPHPMLIFPPFNFFYCDMEDPEDEITGLATYQDSVFIFTGKCTFLWREGMFEPMKIANDVGCIANSSICEFEGKLVWLAKNGVYQYNGDNVKNLTYEKVGKYISGISGVSANKASATIHDRKYFLAAPLEGDTANNMVLIYDFDLEEWYVYEYMFNLNTGERIYIDYLFNYSEGADETLYAGVHRESNSQSFIVRLESGYSDYWYHAANSSDGGPIECILRTKYFDFDAPEIEKAIRNVYINLCGYAGGAELDLFVGQTDSADNTTALVGTGSGFIVNESIVNEDYIENAANVSLAISMPQGLTGAAFQLGMSVEQWGAPLEIKSIGIDWLPKRKVARAIGG